MDKADLQLIHVPTDLGTYELKLADEQEDVPGLPLVEAFWNVQLVEHLAEELPAVLLGLLVDALQDVECEISLHFLIDGHALRCAAGVVISFVKG